MVEDHDASFYNRRVVRSSFRWRDHHGRRRPLGQDTQTQALESVFRRRRAGLNTIDAEHVSKRFAMQTVASRATLKAGFVDRVLGPRRSKQEPVFLALTGSPLARWRHLGEEVRRFDQAADPVGRLFCGNQQYAPIRKKRG